MRSARKAPADDEAATALVSRLAAGDTQALGALYDLYAARCYGLATRLLPSSTLAEDAVQETFLSLWRAPDRFRPERGSVGAYLLTLTHRRAVDLLRREVRERRQATSDGWLASLPDDVEGVSDQVANRDQARRVRRALGALPAGQREALVLAYFAGHTQQEIAALTGVPLGTVKARMVAGVRRMRASLRAGQRGPEGTEA